VDLSFLLWLRFHIIRYFYYIFDCSCNSIDKRRTEVLDRRQKIKERAADRHNALLAAQGFQEFKRDADEVSAVLCSFPVLFLFKSSLFSDT
jgi:hypothetical protein